jgi:hypothetical protein
MSEHLPRHQLEDILADAARAPEHLAACERCSERLRNMEAARAAFAREHSASDFARRVMALSRPAPRRDDEWTAALGATASDFARKVMGPRPPAPRGGYAWAAAFGAFAGNVARKVMAMQRPGARRGFVSAAAFGAFVLAAVAMFVQRDPSEDVIRYRGTSASLQAYVQDGRGAHAVHDGEVLSGGAQLAFAYTLSEPQHLLLFGIDDAGAITRYFPDEPIAHSSALPAGAKRQLPVGIELDARRGRERLIALFSREPLDRESVQDALGSAWRQMRARGKGISEPFELALPAQQISLWFEKQ